MQIKINNYFICYTALDLGMADVHNKATRSYNMSRIKGKDTKPEMLVRTFLHANGYRYKLHDKKLPKVCFFSKY
jgi:hypothetical protein